MIVNSKFSSLSLVKKEQWKAPFDRNVCYVQKFAMDEEIRIQLVSDTDVLTFGYTDEQGVDTPVNARTLYSEDGKTLYEIVFSVDTPGEYTFHIDRSIFYDPATFHESGYAAICGNIYTARFAVKPCCELNNTILLSYTHRRNEYDTQFISENGDKKRFNFRIEGGFYPGDKTQALDNEVFRDQRFTAYQTAAETYEVSVLTVGTKKGVPQWVGNKINSIFKLSDVLVDGIKTVRNESSIPELIQVGTYYPLYVFKLNVEQPDTETASASFACGFFVTFRGNGGVTPDGKTVAGVLTPSATKWADVPKPVFSKSGEPPTGFTAVPDDGSTQITPGYVVSDNMSVYAFYDN